MQASCRVHTSLAVQVGWRRAWRSGGRCAQSTVRGVRRCAMCERGRERNLRWDLRLYIHVYSQKVCSMTHMCAIYNKVPM